MATAYNEPCDLCLMFRSKNVNFKYAEQIEIANTTNVSTIFDKLCAPIPKDVNPIHDTMPTIGNPRIKGV
jgi:hypothetical protein